MNYFFKAVGTGRYTGCSGGQRGGRKRKR